MLKETPLRSLHQSFGAKMVDFGGWLMPLHYGSQVEEHHQVRQDAGLFDVSHMTIVDVTGSDAKAYLQKLLANDVDKLKVAGKALYSCMLNGSGGVIDDLIVYYWGEQAYRVVVNAATRDKDWQWLNQQALGFTVTLNERDDLAMIAVQGPQAIAKLFLAKPQVMGIVDSLGVFQAGHFENWVIAKTGYTGEAGVEIMLPAEEVEELCRDLVESGVKPIGLGARDTLRLEAAMALYGQDMDENVTPFEAGLAWTLDFSDPQRQFNGRAALEAQQAQGIARLQMAFVLEEKGVLRAHQVLEDAQGKKGEITSGTFSPTLGMGIALARVEAGFDGATARVAMRNKLLPLKQVQAPFVRHGKAMI